MIHISKLSVIMERVNNGQPVPFSFKAVKKSGEIIEGQNCILTSSYHKNNTLNIKFPNGQLRKLRKVGIIEINGTEVVV